jgi:hypothetical protein
VKKATLREHTNARKHTQLVSRINQRLALFPWLGVGGKGRSFSAHSYCKICGDESEKGASAVDTTVAEEGGAGDAKKGSPKGADGSADAEAEGTETEAGAAEQEAGAAETEAGAAEPEAGATEPEAGSTEESKAGGSTGAATPTPPATSEVNWRSLARLREHQSSAGHREKAKDAASGSLRIIPSRLSNDGLLLAAGSSSAAFCGDERERPKRSGRKSKGVMYMKVDVKSEVDPLDMVHIQSLEPGTSIAEELRNLREETPGRQILCTIVVEPRSVANPDPDCIRILSGLWIRIRIQEGKNDPEK